MAEYEMVQEIKNMCRNNQMRDVFFREVECDDPVAYVRSILKGKEIQIDTEKGADGTVTVHAVVDGLIQKFVFTQICFDFIQYTPGQKEGLCRFRVRFHGFC